MMITTTDPVPQQRGHYRLSGVLRSEWTKLRTVRTSQQLCLGLAAATIAAGAIISSLRASQWLREPAARAGYDPANVTLGYPLIVAALGAGVLGVLCMTDEYSTGMIRASLAAVPGRLRLLAAKAAVLALAALLVGEAVSFATFLAGQAVLRAGRAPSVTLGQPGVLRAVALPGAYLALLALFGLGLGTVVRHAAGAVAAYAAIVLVLPLLLAGFPGHPARFMPETMLSSSVTAVLPQPASNALPPGWNGLLVMAGYAALALTAAGVLISRRDA
jgi:hypothetical protein